MTNKQATETKIQNVRFADWDCQPDAIYDETGVHSWHFSYVYDFNDGAYTNADLLEVCEGWIVRELATGDFEIMESERSLEIWAHNACPGSVVEFDGSFFMAVWLVEDDDYAFIQADLV